MFVLEGYPLEIALTTANSAAQAWYGYDQVSGLLKDLCSSLTHVWYADLYFP